MPDSPIRKLAPFAVAAKAAGRKVLHLNIGQPDIQTPAVALDAVRNMDRTVIEYSPSDGFASYREGLSGYYSSVGVDVNPDQIIVTTGGSEALIFAFQACLEPGDEVIIPEPFYANYLGFAASAGVKVSATSGTCTTTQLPPEALRPKESRTLTHSSLITSKPSLDQPRILEQDVAYSDL